MSESASTPLPGPLVSVEMIFFNAEVFIREAIESVLAQTYPWWELLLVDDGSADASTTIARDYAARFPEKIRYLEHPGHQNRGTGPTRNAGISHARGDYIAFLDADDVWLPHALDTMVRLARLHPDAGMIYGPTLLWHSWNGAHDRNRRDHLDFKPGRGVPPNTLVQSPGLLPVFIKDGGAVPCMCSLLVRRAVVEEIGGFEEHFRRLYEDQAFYIKVALTAPVYVTGDYWARYRQHAGSSCAVALQNGEEQASRDYFLTWLEGYLEEHQMNDPQLETALRQARRPPQRTLLQRVPRALARPRLRARGRAVSTVRDMLPTPVRRWASARWRVRPGHLPVGRVKLGDLRRLRPVSRAFGFERGQPIDRYYIERFLMRQAYDIRGRVLEIGDDFYTRQFGQARVTQRDILHVNADNPKATIVGDLANADHIASDSFDCIILTQTLHLIYDLRPAIQTLYRILKPNGVLLATVPGISQISNDEWGETWYWSFTSQSAGRLMAEAFPRELVRVEAFGNVLSSSAFLYGLASQELTPAELNFNDPQYPMLITIKATKPARST